MRRIRGPASNPLRGADLAFTNRVHHGESQAPGVPFPPLGFDIDTHEALLGKFGRLAYDRHAPRQKAARRTSAGLR